MDAHRFARGLRRDMTDAEAKLWPQLRGRQLQGVKFRRQMPIGRFVADFASVEAKLVIELDGGQHAEQVEADAERSAAIEAAGFLVLRFWNNDVLTNIDGVLAEIASVLATRPEAS
jgi:very-short-patch-repair endonuclease